MKFFYPLESENKFVLSWFHAKKYKTNYSTHPRKTFKTFTYTRTAILRLGPGHKMNPFNHFYMYICNLLNSPKRSRAIFVMAEKRCQKLDAGACSFLPRKKANLHNIHGKRKGESHE